MEVARTAVFRGILEQPRGWPALLASTGVALVGYLGLLVTLLAYSEDPRPVPPAAPPRRLTVTLLDAPKVASLRALGHSGGSEGGGSSLTVQQPAPTMPHSEPRARRPSARAKESEPANVSQTAPPVESTPPPPADPATAPREVPRTEPTASATTGERGRGSSETGSGEGVVGRGTGTGTGGSGVGSGAGSKVGIASGDTTVLPFQDGMSRPTLLEKVDPEYTREAREARVEGTILTKCVITPEGTLQRCRIVKGQPLMDQAVLGALAKWRYSPVVYQGKPVAVEYVVPIRLVLPR